MLGYEPLEKKGYQHRIVFLSGRRKQASELLPRVHQGSRCSSAGCWARTKARLATSIWLDEFVFRFNRRSSRSRGSTALCSRQWPWTQIDRSSPT